MKRIILFFIIFTPVCVQHLLHGVDIFNPFKKKEISISAPHTLMPEELKSHFIEAIKNEDVDRVVFYLGTSIDVNFIADSMGQTPLHLAINKGYMASNGERITENQREIVKLLIEHGAKVNAQGFGGETPLMQAMRWEDPALIGILIQAGADRSIKNDYGQNSDQIAKEIEEQFRKNSPRRSR